PLFPYTTLFRSSEGKFESYVRFAIDREPDQQHLKVLEHEISKVLADVRLAVRDWRKMRQKMLDASETIDSGPPGADEELRRESKALLKWMADEHFTFLGYREYGLQPRHRK